MTTEQWKCEQNNNEIIDQVLNALKSKAKPYEFTSEQAKQMYRYRSKFIIQHGLLYK